VAHELGKVAVRGCEQQVKMLCEVLDYVKFSPFLSVLPFVSFTVY